MAENEDEFRTSLNYPDVPVLPVSGWGMRSSGEDAVIVSIELKLDPQSEAKQLVRMILSREDCARFGHDLQEVAKTRP